MDVTAGTDSVKKKSMNSGIKRSRSITDRLKVKRAANLINVRDYFTQERTFTDVKIRINQEIIWCDKALLAAASPVLCEELLKLNTKDEILVLHDVQFEEFLLLLQFIYPIFNPEINEQTISALIKLSHRFQFNVLKQACRFYIMKYLSTIRHVSSNCRSSNVEDDYFLNNSLHQEISANEIFNEHDLIEFHNKICIDAHDIVFNLCQWLKIYFDEHDMLILSSIIRILQQISMNNLIRVLNSMNLTDGIKAYVYKARAQYLEAMQQMKHLA